MKPDSSQACPDTEQEQETTGTNWSAGNSTWTWKKPNCKSDWVMWQVILTRSRKGAQKSKCQKMLICNYWIMKCKNETLPCRKQVVGMWG